MNIEEYRDYCLAKPGTTESFPFDNTTLVFKVGGKIYALTNIEVFESINLKSPPEINQELREHYQGIKPGYHMNKKHWNTVDVHSDVPTFELLKMIDQSYDLVFNGLTKKQKESLGNESTQN